MDMYRWLARLKRPRTNKSHAISRPLANRRCCTPWRTRSAAGAPLLPRPQRCPCTCPGSLLLGAVGAGGLPPVAVLLTYGSSSLLVGSVLPVPLPSFVLAHRWQPVAKSVDRRLQGGMARGSREPRPELRRVGIRQTQKDQREWGDERDGMPTRCVRVCTGR